MQANQIEYAHLPLNNSTLELVEEEISSIISTPEWEADAERLGYLLGVRYTMEECLSRITDAGIRN